MHSLDVPSAKDLLSTDGTVGLQHQAKWSSLAAKVNMIASSANPVFVANHDQEFDAIKHKQDQLAVVLKEGFILALRGAVPTLERALALLLGGEKPSGVPDWGEAMSGLQKLVNMNFNHLFSFDITGALGSDVHKDFQDCFMQPLTTLLARCAVLAEWLKLVCFLSYHFV